MAGPSAIGVIADRQRQACVSPPTVIGGSPRRMAPSPMVAMITATIGPAEQRPQDDALQREAEQRS